MSLLIRLTFIAILAFLAYRFWSKSELGSTVEQISQTLVNPKAAYCQTPLGWRLGNLDPEFGLTATQAEAMIHQAATMWNDNIGQQLLRHDPVNGFLIDFKFDARQQQLLTQRLLQRNLTRYDDAIEPGLQQIPEKVAELNRQIADFHQQKTELETQINQWRPTNPNADAQRRQLEQQQQRLVRDAEWLIEQREQLLRDQNYLNETIRQRNELVETAQPTELSVAFEVGLMTIRQQQRTMTIFAFSSETDLIATIAHEFGHAFGVGHTQDPASIMFHQLTPLQQQLTQVDVDAWRNTCLAP
jgi:hypothetical protein